MSAPIRSMTGFARVQKTTEHGDITVSLKSVNHRGLDLHFHLGAELDSLEHVMRAALKRAGLRGHVDVRCSLLRPANGGFGQSQSAAVSFLPGGLSQSGSGRRHRCAAGSESNSVAAGNPGRFRPSWPRMPPPKQPSWRRSTKRSECSTSFVSARARSWPPSFASKTQLFVPASEEMQRIRAGAIPAFQKRLIEKLQELLGNTMIDPQRLAQEAALLADRGDIGEEISRLQIHSRQLDEILDSGGEVGKRLDFLLQELNRETNTILSKTSGLGDLGLRITELALASKAAIEKIREQALNLE